jgi:hypothetical protein
MKNLLVVALLLWFAGPVSAQDVIVYTKPDGSTGIRIVGKRHREALLQQGMTERAIAQSVWDKTPEPGATNVRIVDAASLPQDRTFRSAWTWDGSTVAVDMPKARTIQRSRMRAIAQREGVKLRSAERDAMLLSAETLNLSPCTTPQMLKTDPTCWPVCLPKE